MKRSKKLTITLGILILIAAGAYLALRTPTPTWPETAVADVDYIYQTIKQSHPGYLDNENLGFPALLESAYSNARRLAEQSVDDKGGFYSRRAMTVPFQDSHLVDTLLKAPQRTRRWPGFVVNEDDSGDIAVMQSESDSAPAIGSTLLSCDGQSVDTLIEKRLAPYLFNFWLATKRQGNLYNLLIDLDNPFLETPEKCVFEEDGQQREYTLDWQPLSDEKLSQLDETFEPFMTQVTGYNQLGNGQVWVSIASLGYTDEDVKAVIDELISNINSHRADISAAPALIVDVRSNLGGATEAGIKIAAALWGEGYIDDHRPRFDQTDWRVSEFNLSQLKKAYWAVRWFFGGDSDIFKQVKTIRDGMREASERGDDYFIQPTAYPSVTDEAALPLPPRIFFLTDHYCVSACLDFADLVLSLPNVVHVGQETSGDTFYLEVVTAKLPSGLGQLVYPSAIHRGRERGVNETYVPQHFFEGNITDREAISQWLSELE